MNRDKQIEEIKNVLVRVCKRARTAQEDYAQDRYAEALYNAGYRKASAEVAEEIFAEIGKGIAEQYPIYSVQSLLKLIAEVKKKYEVKIDDQRRAN